MDAFERAIRMLASRRQTEAELRRKLRQRGHESEEIESTLARLRDLKYVDDEAAAVAWAEELARNGGQGRRRAEQKMIARGIALETARRELERVWDRDTEREHASRVLAKLRRGWEDEKPDARTRAKWVRSLLGRGFEMDVIRELLDRLPGTDEEGSAYV